MVGSESNPARVAIIGSGPSGFYAAQYLQKQKDIAVEIDMFERLPTPFGLVRGGVAPDHQKIKSVTKVYDRIASQESFRFFGNVEFGTVVTHADLQAYYHAIIFAVGAQSDRRLNIPGEDLLGSYPATEFVGWYNAHPDFRDLEFDLDVENVAVIGVGNVAVDVVRILTRTVNELKQTDIADYALDALAESAVKNVYVFGRRGPVQAKFTPTELKELGDMEDVDVILTPDQLKLDEFSQTELDEAADRNVLRNFEHMQRFADQGKRGRGRRIIFRFLTSPVEILGEDRVEAIKVVRNELYQAEDGRIRPRHTEETEVIPVGLVFRSVGYNGLPLPDVPFYERWGIIPNDRGRVLTDMEGEQRTGDYVVGWIKRGPSGVIGTNKPDSEETAQLLVEDILAGKHLQPSHPGEIVSMLKERAIPYLTYEDWLALDQIEQERGEAEGRPRVKFSRVPDMLAAIAERKGAPVGD
ncbi:MAG: FAD-dependent oxidoreductase [Anaerolineae bacterium]